jgi:tRNA modification GTPase
LVGRADVLVWLGEPEQAPPHPRLIKVQAKADVPGRQQGLESSLPISAVTGKGMADLLVRIGEMAKALLPAEGAIALNRRQAELIEEAWGALVQAAGAGDVVLVAESLRQARGAFDRLTGRAGLEDVLDALFNRFCLGK